MVIIMCVTMCSIAGVRVGFVVPDLYVHEGDGAVLVCIDVKDAEFIHLEEPITVTMSTFSCDSASGMGSLDS